MEEVQNINNDQIVDIARRIELFHDFSLMEIRRLIDLKTAVCVYQECDTLIRKGDSDRTLFIILSGSVEVHNDQNLITILTSGDFFGEIAFVTGLPRSATIVARERVIVIRLSSSSFDRLPEEIKSKVRKHILEKLAHRLAAMNDLLTGQK